MKQYTHTPQRRLATREEKAWMNRLEAVLMAIPPGLGLYTIGDPDLMVYDRIVQRSENIDISDGGASSAGIVIGCVGCGVNIEGVSG